MKTVKVNNVTELMQAVKAATGDTTIELAPGNYGKLTLDSWKGAIVSGEAALEIVSADPTDPAILSGLFVNGAKNLFLDGLKYDYVAEFGAQIATRSYIITNSDSISVTNSVFDGDIAAGVMETDNGYGSGIALAIDNTSNVLLADNEVYNFYKGFVHTKVTDITVTGNELSRLSSDGIDFAASHRVIIEKNHLHDFQANPNTQAHMDKIQFWTAGQTEASSDVIIRANFIDTGSGKNTHTFLIKSEQGPVTTFKNFLIEDNLIHNSHHHGITINHMDGLTIRNNTILRNNDTAPNESKTYIPTINILDHVTNADISNNVTNGFTGIPFGGGNNLIAQYVDPTQPDYYGNLFVDGMAGSSATIESFVPREGSLIEQMQVGADISLFLEDSVGNSVADIDEKPNDVPVARDLDEVQSKEDPVEDPSEPTTVDQSQGNSEPIAIHQSQGNSEPIATNDFFNVVGGTQHELDVISNDVDAENNMLGLTSVQQTSNGTVSISDSNALVYEADAHFIGTDVFYYSISDGNGGTDTGRITINVSAPPAPLNVAPTAVDDSFAVHQDTMLSGSLLENDIDPDGHSLKAFLSSQPNHGTLSVLQDGSFTYLPDVGFSGSDSFSYSVEDGHSGTDSATVLVEVNPTETVGLGSDIPPVELTGSNDNVRYLNAETDNVSGLAGDDHIRTTGGDDFISGGAGNDTLRAGNGDDFLDGGAGNDFMYGGRGSDVFVGGKGADWMKGNYTDKAPDIFVFTAIDLGAIDRIVDFGVAEGDQLDVTDLFSGCDVSAQNVAEMLSIESWSGGSLVSFDATGDGVFEGFVELADVYDVTVQELVADGALLFA